MYVAHSFGAALDRFMLGIPALLGALLILAIGWWIAGLLGELAAKLFRTIHLDRVGDRIGVNDFLSRTGTKMKVSDILGEIITWVFRLIFIEIAADQLGFVQVTEVVNRILFFIPNILVALLILGLGAFFGQILAGVVRGAASEAGMSNPSLLAKLASGAVMAFAIIAAVNELGISPIVVNTLYIGLVAAVSLALGLSFGLGGRDTAARLTEQWVGQMQSTATRVAQTQPAPESRPMVPSGVYDAGVYPPEDYPRRS